MQAKAARPVQKHSIKYDEYVSRIRDLRGRSAADEVAAMRLLVEFEKAKYAWKKYPSDRFEDVIREERFCTVNRYHAFKKAVAELTKIHIDHLGVAASCLIAKQTKGARFRLLNAALQYRNKHDIEPTYQYVSQWIRARKPKSNRPTYGELNAYVEILKAKIVRLGGKVPPMESGHA